MKLQKPKLRAPKLSRPKVSRPKISRPKLGGPQIHAPKFLTDISRDLRDRHLLIPVVALLVAIVAVPVLLKSSTEPAPPSASTGGSLDGSATQPAVLAESVTVRDYRDRLEALKSKNPFRQHFSATSVGKGQGIEELDTSATTGTSAATGTVDTTDTSSSTSTSTATTSSGDTGSTTSSPKPESHWFTQRIDVLVGVKGEEKERNGIDKLTFLPSPSKPVVVFLGATTSGDQAVFQISTDVASSDGDGRCSPSQPSCQYLALREGQSRTFEYTPDGKTYRLKLRDIRLVKLDEAPHAKLP